MSHVNRKYNKIVKHKLRKDVFKLSKVIIDLGTSKDKLEELQKALLCVKKIENDLSDSIDNLISLKKLN